MLMALGRSSWLAGATGSRLPMVEHRTFKPKAVFEPQAPPTRPSRPHGDECRARPSSCHAKRHKIRSQQPVSKVHGICLTDWGGLVEGRRTYCGRHRHATIDKVKCSASFASFSTPLRPIEAGAPTS